MSDVSVAQQVIAKVGLWWPSADEGGLRLAASAWRSFAAEVDGVGFEGSAAARALVGANSGPAVEAFEGFWARYDGASGSYLPGIADGARAMAGALEQFAGAVADARRRVEELAVEVGATLVVGTALAIFTFGAAEAAAAGISAGLIASAASIGVELSATAASIAGGVLAGAAFGAVEAAAVDVAVAQPIRVEGFHDGGFSLDELEGALLGGGALGAVAGGGGSALRALRAARTAPPAPRLIPVAKADPAADALAGRIGGQSRVRFHDDPQGREFDVVSDRYVAQSKPAGYQLNKSGRNQFKATFEIAREFGPTPYFHFEGPPQPDVLRKLAEYADRYGIDYVVDVVPLGG